MPRRLLLYSVCHTCFLLHGILFVAPIAHAGEDETTLEPNTVEEQTSSTDWKISEAGNRQDRFVLGARGCGHCSADGGLTLTADITKGLSYRSLLDIDIEASLDYQRMVLSYGQLQENEKYAFYGSIFYNTGSVDFDFESGRAEVDLNQIGLQLNLLHRFARGSYGVNLSSERTDQARPLSSVYFRKSVENVTSLLHDPRAISVGTTHSFNLQTETLLGSNALLYLSVGIESQRFSMLRSEDEQTWQKRGTVGLDWDINESLRFNLGIDYDLAMASSFAEIGFRNWSFRLERGGAFGRKDVTSVILNYEFGLEYFGRRPSGSYASDRFSLTDLNGAMQRSQNFIPREFTVQIDPSVPVQEILRVSDEIEDEGISIHDNGKLLIDAGLGIVLIERILRNNEPFDDRRLFTIENSSLSVEGQLFLAPIQIRDLYEVYVIDTNDDRFVISIVVEQ